MHLQRYKLAHLLDIAYDNCFLVDAQSAHDLTIFLPSLLSFSDLSAGPPLSLANTLMETVLNNRIKVYEDPAVIKQISELVLQYPSI